MLRSRVCRHRFLCFYVGNLSSLRRRGASVLSSPALHPNTPWPPDRSLVCVPSCPPPYGNSPRVAIRAAFSHAVLAVYHRVAQALASFLPAHLHSPAHTSPITITKQNPRSSSPDWSPLSICPVSASLPAKSPCSISSFVIDTLERSMP
ncbi:hypothetical protein PHLGIDRAFT_424161 [Phlebiopsis gigantea 11061_1 CR5-6]|uniref:Uncharacterized protein n=1 Tax=Phlebiopsis gigantea (strain 11061_1 CR5-6) TaxID=745531 RepID=A0A0C3PLJ9_PHLG1|nr:hypothetical protein PHLGIDRAFT_424161 [Phlebiopsis gigantea 11061_1 CR5-6]